MTLEETRNYIVQICQFYPYYFNKINPSSAVPMWQKVFADMEYEFAQQALVECIKEGQKQPSINELYRKAYDLKRRDFFAKGGRT